MINIAQKSMCCGCYACADFCSTEAISFEKDYEGFEYPKVDKELCIDCGKCEKVCPIINIEKLKHNDFATPKCYAAINKNIEIRFDSTSGGVFSALADKVYKEKGYVGGAIFTEDFSVKEYVSDDKKDLEKLRSSKYLQSDAREFYKEIKGLLDSGKTVLVCGTPCQMAALRIATEKNHDNLILIDFICRGINSPKIFRKYLDSLEKRFGSKVIYFKAKNKELGWRELTSKIGFENGKIFYDTKETSDFTIGYLRTSVYSRPSCYECRFKGFPRIADITLGDFWGAERVVGKELDNDLGTSLIMVNSNKGEKFIDNINCTCKEIPFSSTLKGNKALTESLEKPTVNREKFFEALNNKDFDYVAKKFITKNSNYKITIKNYLRFGYLLYKTTKLNPLLLLKNIRLNLFTKSINTSISDNRYILVASHSILKIEKGGKILLNGILSIGKKKIDSSNLETRILIEKNATLKCGTCNIGYGSDIELFKGANLTLNGMISTNLNTTIICADNIVIETNTMIGRNVTIRDNNGNHVIARRGYKDCRDVYIDAHCWLCEGCTIMPGTKLGAGVIVGAKSYVPGGRFKNHTLLMGNPASVIDEDIYWKY